MLLRRVSHQNLSNWYLQLGQQTAVGIGLAEAIRQSPGPPAADREAMAKRLDRGSSIDDMLKNAPGWLPIGDRYILSAAAESGRMADICNRLSKHHRDLSEHWRTTITACVYPLLVLHGALLFVPLTAALNFSESEGFHFDQRAYLRMLGLAVGSLWGAFLLVTLLFKWLPVTRRRLQFIVPGLRRYTRARSRARFTWTLDALLAAAVPISSAFGGAALACDDPLLTPRLLDILPDIDQGQAPGELLNRVRGLPANFVTLYQTGERTGSLDRSLRILTRQAEDEAALTLRSVTFWYPKLLFALIATLVALTVARVYKQYFDFLIDLT